MPGVEMVDTSPDTSSCTVQGKEEMDQDGRYQDEELEAVLQQGPESAIVEDMVSFKADKEGEYFGKKISWNGKEGSLIVWRYIREEPLHCLAWTAGCSKVR